ncbi:MAG: hypothetical protein HZC44_13745 [Geobacter sp.]|nr:hypothetical protein [Geobacter sp.]
MKLLYARGAALFMMATFSPPCHGGHKPIPVYIKLACIGWEALRVQDAA